MRIVATLGPLTSTSAYINDLKNAGVDIFRLNLSHNTLEWHDNVINTIRATCPTSAILADIPGRKIRTTNLVCSEAFEAGQKIVLYHNAADLPEAIKENKFNYQINSDKFFSIVERGTNFFADDGTLSFNVVENQGSFAIAEALQPGFLKQCKGINVPYSSYGTSELTPKDEKFLDFCLSKELDFVGISFVDSEKYIQNLTNYIGNSALKIIAKIESASAINNLDSILFASHGVMIDRGDLSVETSIPETGILQKRILENSIKYGTPVIVATETLHSMHNSKYPTKAEVNDITNSILDNASALMLSGETAVGEYPLESVSTMKSIIKAVTSSDLYTSLTIKNNTINLNADQLSQPDLMAAAVSQISNSNLIKKVVLLSKSGDGARYLSKYINKEIIAFTDCSSTIRNLLIYKNIRPIYLDQKFLDDPRHIYLAASKMISEGYNPDSLYAFIYVSEGGLGLRLNTIHVNALSTLSQKC